ncbi:hypothetical protein J437_LFUL012578 [Ladona fulva]|uniref:Receptor ligand binding region domain-containing protein n=1 Tax=Ladona fulva TaxID=123851 RepID=A0A8K0KHZ5_LADFU|nr:hypothetical protein J437_LFUL012578 [Ladona fulva]
MCCHLQKCSDHQASLIPTFARTEPPKTQVTKSIIALMKYYNWKVFSVLAEEPWEAVAKSLVQEADGQNMTVKHERIVGRDYLSCCSTQKPCCHSGFWYKIIQETKNLTRSKCQISIRSW